MVLPVTLINFAKFMSTDPILTMKLIVRLMEHIFFSFFKYGGGQGALNFSKWRHDLFFNFLLNMEGPTPGGHQLWKWRDDRTDSKLFLLQINTNNTHRLALFVCWEMSMASQMCNKSKNTYSVFRSKNTWKT